MKKKKADHAFSALGQPDRTVLILLILVQEQLEPNGTQDKGRNPATCRDIDPLIVRIEDDEEDGQAPDGSLVILLRQARDGPDDKDGTTNQDPQRDIYHGQLHRVLKEEEDCRQN